MAIIGVSKTFDVGSIPTTPAIIKIKTVKTVFLFLTKTIKHDIINYKVKKGENMILCTGGQKLDWEEANERNIVQGQAG